MSETLTIEATRKKEFREKNPTHKRIVLVGRAASGKDHLRKIFEQRGYKYGVSYTTRPPRPGEISGVDYIFLTPEEFQSKAENGDFYEYVGFNGWYYGTTVEQFFTNDLFIMTPHGISKIDPEDRKNTFIIFLDIEENVRKERLALRNDSDKVDRRIAADNADFTGFDTYDVRFNNSNF